MCVVEDSDSLFKQTKVNILHYIIVVVAFFSIICYQQIKSFYKHTDIHGNISSNYFECGSFVRDKAISLKISHIFAALEELLYELFTPLPALI